MNTLARQHHEHLTELRISAILKFCFEKNKTASKHKPIKQLTITLRKGQQHHKHRLRYKKICTFIVVRTPKFHKIHFHCSLQVFLSRNASRRAFTVTFKDTFLDFKNCRQLNSPLGPALTIHTLNAASRLCFTQPPIHPHQPALGYPEDRKELKELDPCGLCVFINLCVSAHVLVFFHFF